MATAQKCASIPFTARVSLDLHLISYCNNIQRYKLLKVVFKGESESGKTSIINRFLRNEFTSEYKPSQSVEFDATSIDVQGHQIALQLWDIPQRPQESVSGLFYKGADAFVLVLDVNSAQGLQSLEANWTELQSLYQKDLRSIPVLVFGNKTDEQSTHTLSADATNDWMSKRGDNVLYRTVACKNEHSQETIDAALKELVALILKHDPGTPLVTMTATEQAHEQRFKNIKRHQSQKQRLDPVSTRICSPGAGVCSAHSGVSGDQFCRIL